MIIERLPMTREGYEKLKAELTQLRDHDMIEVTKRVAAARDLGDLSENAEYHAAREDQGMLQARINLLSDKLSRAEIVDPTKLPRNQNETKGSKRFEVLRIHRTLPGCVPHR